MRRRLMEAGQRPISALVDATNYLMLATGRPAHVYDLAKLRGPITARRAQDGEKVLALNGKTYTLDGEMTVIADANGVHDIGGIMGGEESSVTEATSDVLLEIAYFDPARIGPTGRRLGLASDARTRFERGVDPEFLDDGLALLTDLIVKSCGGRPSEPVRAGQPPVERQKIAYDPALASRLGGIEIAPEEQRRILSALDFDVSDDWQVTVPARRHDVEGPADIVEEVVRIHGIDAVESVALPRISGVARPTATPAQRRERRVRRAAAAAGLDEAVTWSFISEKEAAVFGGGHWTLDNPISEDLKVMRPSLLPGLLAAARRNADRGATSVRLFEIGRRYLADGEKLTLTCVLAGDKTTRSWQGGKARAFDAFDAKAIALRLLEAAGAPADKLMVMEAETQGGEAVYHPGQSASLRLGPKNVLASFGMVHPRILKAMDVDGPVAALTLYLDAIPQPRSSGFARAPYQPPALQSVTRDFAFLVDAALPAGDLLKTVRGADKAHIVDARIFDLFAGQGVPEGQKSLAVEITLQPGEKSFTEDELKAISDKVVAAAAKLGAQLRG
jgi:phenylalanyl-tRNA synthetase beta chain